eukprot:gene6179-9459_t
MKRRVEDDDDAVKRRKQAAALRVTAQRLPVAEAEEGIWELVQRNQAVVLLGETGSGKTTQVPQFLMRRLAKGAGIIGVTQPRRIAAITVALRVAEEANCKVGGTVGYCVRFDDKTSRATRIKYMTDGILLRELLTSDNLSQYSILILDEAHERSVNSDILLGLIKQLAQRRSDLKIVIMSATLNAGVFSRFWNNCPIAFVGGRTFPVDTFYTVDPVKNIIDGAVSTVLQIHVDHPDDPGDILVFLTGQDTIEDCLRLLQDKVPTLEARKKAGGTAVGDLLPVPLYANLSVERQARAFVPPPKGARKVILSTNVAETSLTIPNIRYVVDCGLVKEKRYNPRTGMESLVEVEVSQAQAKQRSGRAGRVQSGECYRMYTEQTFLTLPTATEPEIRRVNLTAVVLQLKCLGVENPLSFDFIDPPQRQHIVAALHLLYLLGALSSTGEVTELGMTIGAFPLEPTHAKTLLTALEFGVFESVVSILSMLSVENVLTNPTRKEREAADKSRAAFASPHGDHLTLLNLYNDYKKQKTATDRKSWCRHLFINERRMLQVTDVRKQLCDLLVAAQQKKKGLSNKGASGSTSASQLSDVQADAPIERRSEQEDGRSLIRKAFCYGFFQNVAQYDADRKSYVTIEARQEVGVHPTSCLFRSRAHPALLVYNELVLTKKRYMRNCVAVEEQWLIDAAPGRWRR